MSQLDGLVDAGNTVILVEHDMQIARHSDWMIDMGPGAGTEAAVSSSKVHRQKLPNPRPAARLSSCAFNRPSLSRAK